MFKTTVMEDSLTHAVVMIRSDGIEPNNIGTFNLDQLSGHGLDAFGQPSSVVPKIAITRIQSFCSPPSLRDEDDPNPVPGYTLQWGEAIQEDEAGFIIPEGTVDFDNLYLTTGPGNEESPITVGLGHRFTSFILIVTLKKIAGFAGSAQA